MTTPIDPNSVLEQLPDGVLAVGADGNVSYVNNAAEHLLRTSRSRCVGTPMAEFLERAPAVLQLATDAVSSPGVRVFRHGLRCALPTRQCADAVAVADDDGALVMTLRDASLSADLTRDGQRADQIEAMQTVASGLAHEIKNPLGGMRGALQLLARELAGDASAREYIDVVLGEIDRVSGIVDSLKSLANPPESMEPVEVDLNRLLREIALLQRADLELDPALPPLLGDAAALTQAFLNLVRNAHEAGADRIVIRTRVATGVTYRDETGRKHPLVEVEVEDDGPGIPDSELQQIFTPFYTTKASGSGLGLATTQRIISSHLGRIAVESTSSGESTGTKFVITVPAMGNRSHSDPRDAAE